MVVTSEFVDSHRRGRIPESENLVFRGEDTSLHKRSFCSTGLSMGGLQAIEIGIVHLGYFSWIGAFSPGVISEAFSDEFNSALMEPDKINKRLLLFQIISGDNDELVGKHVTEFESRLKQANVQHIYTLLPGGTHSMFVWRPALLVFSSKYSNIEAQRKMLWVSTTGTP
jgi:enterochelin esterase-like enzyme